MMLKYMFAKKIIPTLFLFCLLFPSIGVANEITIRPFLIDETVEARDVLTRTITLTNQYQDRKLVVFATVNEISVDSAGEIKEFITPVMTDRTNTVTSWVEISRGRIELEPGATIEVPLTLRIHPYVKYGEYHVFIGFVPESTRPEAEKIALQGEAGGVIVKVTVADDIQESLRVGGFLIDRFVIVESDRNVSIKVRNDGELPSTPSGEVIFYNSKGEEVAAIPVNTSGTVVAPGEEITLSEKLPIENDLGRYKANLDLKYGVNQKASLADTTFFYSLPLQLVLFIFFGILIITLFVTLLFKRVFMEEKDDEDAQSVVMYVKDTHDAKPKDHDIDLTPASETTRT
jgi:hypothetical protein